VRQIEAKRSADELGKSALETISAFSNEPDLGGGWLLFGVSEIEGSFVPTGVADPGSSRPISPRESWPSGAPTAHSATTSRARSRAATTTSSTPEPSFPSTSIPRSAAVGGTFAASGGSSAPIGGSLGGEDAPGEAGPPSASGTKRTPREAWKEAEQVPNAPGDS
jgi:hypothetical protein